jgi:hypothetical protein
VLIDASYLQPFGSSSVAFYSNALHCWPLRWERRATEWNTPHTTLPTYLHYVIDPTSRVGFLQFIHDLDSVFACGLVIRQDHAVFVIEVIVVTKLKR